MSNDTPGGFPPGLDGPTGVGWGWVDEMAFGLSRLVSKARPRRRPRRPDALRNLKSNHVCFKILRPRVWPPDSYDSPNNPTEPDQSQGQGQNSQRKTFELHQILPQSSPCPGSRQRGSRVWHAGQGINETPELQSTPNTFSYYSITFAAGELI